MAESVDLSANELKKPKGVAYGAASLTRVLNGIDFPVTKQDLIKRYGDKEVQYSKGSLRTLKDLITKCTKESFTSMSELVEGCSRRPLR